MKFHLYGKLHREETNQVTGSLLTRVGRKLRFSVVQFKFFIPHRKLIPSHSVITCYLFMLRAFRFSGSGRKIAMHFNSIALLT